MAPALEKGMAYSMNGPLRWSRKRSLQNIQVRDLMKLLSGVEGGQPRDQLTARPVPVAVQTWRSVTSLL